MSEQFVVDFIQANRQSRLLAEILLPHRRPSCVRLDLYDEKFENVKK